MTLAINIAAAMVLLPKMIDVLIEGLISVRDAAEKQLKIWFPNREFYIGMDTALLIGDSSVLATGLLLIPITILLAFILPAGNDAPARRPRVARVHPSRWSPRSCAATCSRC